MIKILNNPKYTCIYTYEWINEISNHSQFEDPFAVTLTKVQVSEGGRPFACKFLAVHKDNDFSNRLLYYTKL